jgi:hypothetical protein
VNDPAAAHGNGSHPEDGGQVEKDGQPENDGQAKDGYQYDIFLSYPAKGTVSRWVNNIFFRDLKDALTDDLGREPLIYRYTDQQPGVDWRENLIWSLLRSRYMVAIWAPAYFYSPWCRAELDAMLRRQEQLGTVHKRPPSLVYPIIYRDGETFPEYAKAMFYDDMDNMSNWAIPEPSFRDTRDYSAFFNAVRRVAERLNSLLQNSPEWQPGWPFERPADEKPGEPASVLPRM